MSASTTRAHAARAARLLAEQATLQTAYEVSSLFGKTRAFLCPIISGGGSRELFEKDPNAQADPLPANPQ